MITVDIGKYKIIISESVFQIMLSYRQTTKSKNEAGGILLGQMKKNNIYILRASVPNKFDKASRYSFECDKDAAQIIMEYEFSNSNNKTIYLGEWHTHPENIPTPSPVDKRMIKKQFEKGKLNEPFLLMLIMGITEMYIGLYDGKKLKNVYYEVGLG